MTGQQRLELCQQMTLEEKLGMIHGNELFRTKGVERLHIPPFSFSDGPMGVRQEYQATKWIPVGSSQDYTSYLPCNTALAATWNRRLAYESGKVLGREARGRGKDMILAPGINILRTPLCGRNFEYMGEDPFLVSEMVVPMIEGIEENDVASCVKHFAVNNQEVRRLSENSVVDDRALREIYFPGFRAAVTRAKVKGIMGSYNKLWGIHCSQNKKLLQDILRGEWGFEGLVVSDWGGVHDTAEAADSGLDVEMSVTDNFDEYYLANPLAEEIRAGRISEKLIDEKVIHILKVMDDLHMFDGERKSGCYGLPGDRQKLLAAARESVVLLKNSKNLLPIERRNGLKLLVVGDNANKFHASGGGSSEIKALYEMTPLMGIGMIAGGNVEVTYCKGYDSFTTGNIWDAEHADARAAREAREKQSGVSANETAEISENGQAISLNENPEDEVTAQVLTEEQLAMNAAYAEEAVAAAAEADVVIFVGGLNHEFDTEGQDRRDMSLPYHQTELITRLQQANRNVVVVMMSGSPVDLTGILDTTHTLVQYWYSGMEGGRALAEVLFGDVCPSGRLPETFPLKVEDCSAHSIGEYPGKEAVHYSEGIYVGYRHYETRKIPVAYPFGYGLSYTDFKYNHFRVDDRSTEEHASFSVNLEVTNIGEMDGAETVQLYVRPINSSIDRPLRELRQFEKEFIKIGQTHRISFHLNEQAFSYYDTTAASFRAPAGTYLIEICRDAHTVIMDQKVTLRKDYLFV